MKTVEVRYLPGDTCWVKGQYRECIIESVVLEKGSITYNWYNLDVGYDITEVWDDGYFTSEDIGKTVFDTLEGFEKAFPEDFDFGDEDE
jgi:hypothetical protein